MLAGMGGVSRLVVRTAQGIQSDSLREAVCGCNQARADGPGDRGLRFNSTVTFRFTAKS